jgi:hypothetical protein
MANRENKNLVQYVFYDGSELITDSKGKFIACKDPDTHYLPFERMGKRYVHGSTPNPDSEEVSKKPKVNEHLLTGSRYLKRDYRVSTSSIKEINVGFQLPSEEAVLS